MMKHLIVVFSAVITYLCLSTEAAISSDYNLSDDANPEQMLWQAPINMEKKLLQNNRDYVGSFLPSATKREDQMFKRMVCGYCGTVASKRIATLCNLGVGTRQFDACMVMYSLRKVLMQG